MSCQCGYFEWATESEYFGQAHQRWVQSMGPGWVLVDDEGRLQTVNPADGHDTLDDGTPLVHRLEEAARRWAEHLRHLYGWALRPARYGATV
jgi:hypothetical protein